ncbi:MAG: hypothetical protein SGPRY_014133, partial [Prymnesium sp.]
AARKVVNAPGEAPAELHDITIAFISLIVGLCELLPCAVKRMPPRNRPDGKLPYSNEAIFFLQASPLLSPAPR